MAAASSVHGRLRWYGGAGVRVLACSASDPRNDFIATRTVLSLHSSRTRLLIMSNSECRGRIILLRVQVNQSVAVPREARSYRGTLPPRAVTSRLHVPIRSPSPLTAARRSRHAHTTPADTVHLLRCRAPFCPPTSGSAHAHNSNCTPCGAEVVEPGAMKAPVHPSPVLGTHDLGDGIHLDVTRALVDCSGETQKARTGGERANETGRRQQASPLRGFVS